MTNKYC